MQITAGRGPFCNAGVVTMIRMCRPGVELISSSSTLYGPLSVDESRLGSSAIDFASRTRSASFRAVKSLARTLVCQALRRQPSVWCIASCGTRPQMIRPMRGRSTTRREVVSRANHAATCTPVRWFFSCSRILKWRSLDPADGYAIIPRGSMSVSRNRCLTRRAKSGLYETCDSSPESSEDSYGEISEACCSLSAHGG